MSCSYKGKLLKLFFLNNRTVLRELLQNAADAGARKVIVKFETLPSITVPAPTEADETTSIKHVISHHTLKRLLVTNDGQPFTEKDWGRLKRIAEGNPDETKIGAFGVGFYSVFSDCEEPFVSSGSEAMAFYWKENALFTRRLHLGEAESSPNTNFVLDYRSTTSPVPSLIPLCRFMASSLTFAGLESIELWLDQWNLLSLCKKIEPSVTVQIPKGVETRTEHRLMKIARVIREVAHMDASVMTAVSWKPPNASSRLDLPAPAEAAKSLRSFFSRFTKPKETDKGPKIDQTREQCMNGDLISRTTSSISLHISSAQVQTSVSKSFAKELERSTKKVPPQTTSLAILTSSFSPKKTPNDAIDIFASVLPSRGGKIFIGFPTHQTTGLNAHVSVPSLIPTVERESIDLNARWVRDWNMELLGAAGVVCRVAWATEMTNLKGKLPSTVTGRINKYHISPEDISALVPEAVFTSNQFIFREATPSARVGRAIEDSFWTSDKTAYFEIMSTCGILPTWHVRIAPKDLSFMSGIPVLPDEFVSGAQELVKRLTDFGLITEVTITDIQKELENNALTSQQLSEFLKWASKKSLNGEIEPQTIKQLLLSVVVQDETADGSPSPVLCLNTISSYLNANRIPMDLPIPPFVMPFKYTYSLPTKALDSFGWKELRADSWVQWLINMSSDRRTLSSDQDITQSAKFSGRILPVLSKQWDANLGVEQKDRLVKLLQAHTIMPTKTGMKKPSETYFPSVKLFDDLPVISGLSNVKERFLIALGVRKTVELNVIFERLFDQNIPVDNKENGGRKWNHVDLIRYLASVKDDIPLDDLRKFRNARICLAGTDGGPETEGARYRVFELFEPENDLRELGLPIIYWPGQYRASSSEGRFLSMLGLKKYPSATDLITIMAESAGNGNLKQRDKALAYFIINHVANGYSNFDASRVITPFLPVENSTKLLSPGKCFVNEDAKLFGFDLLRKDIRKHAGKFGVKENPPLKECLTIFTKNLPASKKEAKIFFEYFSKRLGELDSGTATRISQTAIIPASRNMGSQKVIYLAPRDCYLGESEDYGEIFEFVDFGEEANMFLLACGSKREPTKVEVATLLVKEPANVLYKLQTPDKYLKLLRHIAENIPLLRKHYDVFREMKTSSFLLASKELQIGSSSHKEQEKVIDTTDDDDFDDIYGEESDNVKEWQLARAQDIAIVDDYSSFNLFKQNFLAAPQEEPLENLYASLGTPVLSSLVEEHAKCGELSRDQRTATKLRKQIFERVRLFLHEHTPDSIRHDNRWLERHLYVQVVSSILHRRNLRGSNISHVEKRSALLQTKPKDAVLSITTGKIDMYQISQALVPLLLCRPKLHSTLTLEMLLKTDLLELRARGYNVERILRQKAAEARIAENQRQKGIEEEQRQIKESEAAWREQQQKQVASLPGVFPEPFGNTVEDIEEQEKPEKAPTALTGTSGGSIFSDWGRRFGNIIRDATRDASMALENRNSIPPPPYESTENSGKGVGTIPPQQRLQNNLLSAVQSCRPYGSNGLFNRGEQHEVTEKKTYCDERPSSDLTYATELNFGIKVFTDKSLDISILLSDHVSGFQTFSSVLADCAKVLSIRTDCICIFYEPQSKTIAFNTSGSIFCNYTYFEHLHLQRITQHTGCYDTLVYWWVIFCHELAHNLVADHSSDHSYYT